jgi:hypothetical protein
MTWFGVVEKDLINPAFLKESAKLSYLGIDIRK